MTIGGWIFFGFLALMIIGIAGWICAEVDTKSGVALSI